MKNFIKAFYGLMFSYLWLSMTVTAQSIQGTFTICLGESIFLPAEQTFPRPPLGPTGPDGMLPFNCTPQLSSIRIAPESSATAQELSGFNVSPTSTTTFEVTSRGGCGAPGVGFISDEITWIYEVIVDQSCTSNITEVFTICPGTSVQLPATQTFPAPPQGPIGPDGISTTLCTPRLTEIRINPEANATPNGLTDFTVNPMTSTIYEVTSLGFCGAPGIGANSDEITLRYAVMIDQNCPAPTVSPIFLDFPWVSSLVNPNDCSIESIQVYQQSIFRFLLIKNEFGEERLYFENGQFYCQNSMNYDCVSAYGFGAPIATWNCGDATTPIPDCANYSGTVFFEECDDNGLYFFIRLADGSVLDPYFAESFNIVIQNGQQVNFDYVANDFDTPCSIAEAAVLITCIEEVSDIGENVGIFDNFPWLNQLINPNNCNGESISVYQSGIFQFVFVESNNTQVLYFEDGTRYCMDAPNYDCRALYNLGTPINTWTCGSSFNAAVIEKIIDSTNEPAEFKVFPNPAIGPLTIQLGIQQEAQQIRLYDLHGRLLQEVGVATNSGQRTIIFDTSPYEKGIYLLEWQSGTARKIEKVVKK